MRAASRAREMRASVLLSWESPCHDQARRSRESRCLHNSITGIRGASHQAKHSPAVEVKNHRRQHDRRHERNEQEATIRHAALVLQERLGGAGKVHVDTFMPRAPILGTKPPDQRDATRQSAQMVGWAPIAPATWSRPGCEMLFIISTPSGTTVPFRPFAHGGGFCSSSQHGRKIPPTFGRIVQGLS